MPDISIIIPFKNSAEWLPETLASVIAQKPGDYSFDLILIDDASTDSSVEVVRNILGATPIKFEILKGVGNGPALARNLGIQHSKSPWIQILDSDDLLHPEKLASQIKLARETDDSVAEVYSPWTTLLKVKETWEKQPGVELATRLGDGPIAFIRSDGFVPNASALIRKFWINRAGGYDPELQPIEDVGLQTRLAILGGRFVPDSRGIPLYFYRKREDSFSRESHGRFIQGCCRNAERVEAHYRGMNQLTEAVRKDLAKAYFLAARYYARFDLPKFEALCAKILTLDPTFIPEGPRKLRWAAKLMGYPKAERLAARYSNILGR